MTKSMSKNMRTNMSMSMRIHVRFLCASSSPHHGRGEGIQQQPGARLTMACFTLPPWHMTARKIFATGQCQREPTTSNLFCSIVTRDAMPSHTMSYAGCSALISLHETWQEPVLFRYLLRIHFGVLDLLGEERLETFHEICWRTALDDFSDVLTKAERP